MKRILSGKRDLPAKVCEMCRDVRQCWTLDGLGARVFRSPCRCARDAEQRASGERHEAALAYARRAVDRECEMPERFAQASRADIASPIVPEAFDAAVASLPGVDAWIRGMVSTGASQVNPCQFARRGVVGHTGFALVGDVGLGKTHAMAALLNNARGLLVPGRMVSVVGLMSRVRASFGDDRSQTEAEILRCYSQTPLLVLDDIDKPYATEWAVTLLYELINLRYEAQLPTFITSNATAQQLRSGALAASERTATHGSAIVDRLVEMCPIWLKLTGTSRRRPSSPSRDRGAA